jgi:hypothetical protein
MVIEARLGIILLDVYYFFLRISNKTVYPIGISSESCIPIPLPNDTIETFSCRNPILQNSYFLFFVLNTAQVCRVYLVCWLSVSFFVATTEVKQSAMAKSGRVRPPTWWRRLPFAVDLNQNNAKRSPLVNLESHRLRRSCLWNLRHFHRSCHQETSMCYFCVKNGSYIIQNHPLITKTSLQKKRNKT